MTQRWDCTLMTKKWASVFLGEPTPFIHMVDDRQSVLRLDLGEAWRNKGETAKEGWKRAYKGGWRILPVNVAIAYQGKEP